jgi:hypothetical protein
MLFNIFLIFFAMPISLLLPKFSFYNEKPDHLFD